jgi:hypothetical protein
MSAKRSLTPAETDIVKVLHTIDHMSDGPMEAGVSGVWGGCITDRIRSRQNVVAAAASGILSSLVKKGILKPEGEDEGDGLWMTLTEDGYLTWVATQEAEEPTRTTGQNAADAAVEAVNSALSNRPEELESRDGWSIRASLIGKTSFSVIVRVVVPQSIPSRVLDNGKIDALMLEESRRIAAAQRGGSRFVSLDGVTMVGDANSELVYTVRYALR